MGLLALPALWAGRDGSAILRIMIEAVERITPLYFAYAHVGLVSDAPRTEILRLQGAYAGDEERAEWRAAAEEWSQSSLPDGRPMVAATPVPGLNVVRFSLSYGRYGGEIWFGSAERTFPAFTQVAYLRAATSLAAAGLQSARAHQELERASRVKDEFLAMLGHELRNPLAPITTALEVIKLKSEGAVEYEHQIIERQAKHLSRLVDDLLDVSRITRGKMELRKEDIDLNTVIFQAVEDASPLLEERQHGFTVNLPDEEVWVRGDMGRLKQVFSNLLVNAAKYTDPGGSIEVSGHVTETEVAVSVCDNGSGISAELLPRLFTIFEQGHANIDRSSGGLGIGLALVQNFVTLHQGTVTVASEGVGKGSKFTVRLPRLKATRRRMAVAPDAAALSPPVQPRRILLVDDNVDALNSMSAYLRVHGHEVAVTPDPTEALKMIESFAPHAAILDIGLPVIDGYELATQLRRKYSSESLLLIALTGYGQAKDVDQSRKAGFDVHLTKPVEMQKLNEALESSAATRNVKDSDIKKTVTVREGNRKPVGLSQHNT